MASALLHRTLYTFSVVLSTLSRTSIVADALKKFLDGFVAALVHRTTATPPAATHTGKTLLLEIPPVRLSRREEKREEEEQGLDVCELSVFLFRSERSVLSEGWDAFPVVLNGQQLTWSRVLYVSLRSLPHAQHMKIGRASCRERV